MFVHLSRKLLGLLVVLAVFVAAQLFIPTKIEASSNTLNFQSKIVFKSSGLNITAGSSVPSCIAGGADTCDFQMRFYTVSSAGTAIYTETFSNVEIGDTNGIFNLVLNSVCSATASGIYQWGATSVGGCSIPTGVDFSQDLYYEFSFDPDGDGDFAEGENFPSSGTRPALRKAPSAYYAQVAGSVTADSLDYDDFEDTMDLDAALTLNQGTNTWTQNFTGTTTNGLTLNTNSLTSGAGLTVSSSATAMTGNLQTISLSSSNVNNTGDLLELSIAATNAARGLYISNLGTGDSFRVDDVGSDTTPFIIDASGNISVGGNITTTATSIDLLNTTATTINFGAATTTLNLAGGSGSTGCTINSSGDLTCSGAVTGTGAAAFLLGGNSFGALGVLGTNDANSLAFETNGTERMRLTTTGGLILGATTSISDLHIQTGSVSAGSTTMSFTSTNSTFTTSASITLNAGDTVIPVGFEAQARTIASTATGTSFTVTEAFSATFSGMSFNIARRGATIEGPLPVLALNRINSGYVSQEWLLRVGGSTPGSRNFDIFSQTTGATGLTIEQDGTVMVGTGINHGGVGNNSRLFVYGGTNGANIDVMGDASAVDEARIEVESSDWGTSNASAVLEYYGVTGSVGTLAGHNRQLLGALRFRSGTGTALLMTDGNIPLRIATNDTEMARFESNGNFSALNDITISGGDLITDQTTFNLINTAATTINFGGAATTINIGPGGATATSLVLAGGSGATGCTLAGASGDLACSGDITAAGGDLITGAAVATLFDTGASTSLSIGGATPILNLGTATGAVINIGADLSNATTINLGGGSGSSGCTVNGATGNLTCSGQISGSLSADSLDYSSFEDTMDLDAALTLNQGSFIWTQNFTGTTTVGQTYNVNSLTTGTGFAISSTATGLTTGGNLASIALTGSNVANVGDLLDVSVTGTLSAARLLYLNNLGTGDSVRIDDVASDSTPFTIDASGNVSVGGNISTSATSIDLLNTTATTINFGGAATTLNIAGGSGSTGCTINSSGDVTCSGDITATGGDIITTSTTAALFNTGATTAVNIAGAATTTNLGGTTVNLAGGSGSTGCTIDSSGNFSCTGTVGSGGTIAADSLDFIDFEDTMDLDASLTLNQTTNTWSQTFTGTTTVGQTYTANSLTSGTAFAIASTATNFTGNLQTISLTGNSTFNTGDLLELSISGTTTDSRALYISNLGTGDSLRILDDPSDGTPFVIDQHGNVTTGGHIDTWLSTIGLLGTPTSITFGGAATTLNIGPGSTTATSILLAGGSGATGCTLTGANGDFACSGDITATGGDIITTSTTAALFNTGATTAVNIAGAATTTNLGGTTVNLAGGSGSTGCTIDSSGNLSCTGTIAASITADSLDFVDFQDTLDLDAGLTLNQTTNTWSQTFTGTTTAGFTYTANSLTSGTASAIASSATAMTGNIQTITLSGNSTFNTGDLLELAISGTSTAARALYISNLGTGDSIRILDDASDGTPFVIDQHGNVTTGGHIDTWLSTIGLLGTPTSITFGGAATTMNIGPGSTTATTLLFAGGSAATGCSMTGNDGAFSCTSTIAAGAFSTGGNITGAVLSGSSLSVTGAVSSNSVSTGGVTATGLVNTGNGAVDYTPTSGNWGSTGSTILLNAANYSTISFHDSGARVDAIRVGAGTMTLGYNVGYGSASVLMPGTVSIGNSTLTETLNVGMTYPGAQAFVASFFHDGNNANADGILIQGGQDDGLSTTIYLQARDGDGTNVGRLANVAGTFALADQSDRRTKTNIVNTTIQGLSTLNALRVVDYNRIQAPNGPIIHGFIAQEVQEVYPFAVFEEDDQGMLSLSKELMIPMIVKATQELNTKVDNEYLTLSANDATTSSNLNGLTVKVTSMESKLNNIFASLDTQKLRIDSFENRITELESQIGLIQGYVLPSTASFEELVISGKIAIEGLLTLSNKNIGISKIAVGESEVAITFETPFPQKPIVIATPIDSYASFKVNEITETGFKILVAEPVEEELVFNWFVSSTPE